MDHSTDWSSSYQPLPQAFGFLLEGPGFEAFQDLCVGTFSLAVAPRVYHGSVAYLRSMVSIICFEEIAGELRTIVGDDAIRYPKPANEALDELDR